jgi:hypothetical protein
VVILTLVGCFALASAGAAVAVSGPAGGGVTALTAQYPSSTNSSQQPQPPSLGGTSPATGSGTPSSGVPGTSAPSTSTPAPGNVKAAPPAATPSQNAPTAVQQARQVQATNSGSSLPFTGFAAITVFGLGLVALFGGLVLRRQTVS